MEGGGDKFHAVSEHFYSSSNNSSAFTPNVKLIDDATGMKITIIAADSSNTPRIKTANLIKVRSFFLFGTLSYRYVFLVLSWIWAQNERLGATIPTVG